MKLSRHKIMSAFIKAAAVVTAAILINIILLSNLDTNAWFTSEVESVASVEAASTSDILSSIIVVDGCGREHDYTDPSYNSTVHNPEYFKIKGAMEGKYTIYFQLGDDIQNFVLHVNPIEVEQGKTSRADINISLNPWEYDLLLCYNADSASGEHGVNPSKKPEVFKDQIIYGTIYVKYLNSYIDRRIPVSFDRWYLMLKDLETINYISDKQAKIAKLQEQVEKLVQSEEALKESMSQLAKQNSSKDSKIQMLQENVAMYSQQLEDLLTSENKPGNETPNVPAEGPPLEGEIPPDPVIAEPETPAAEPVHPQELPIVDPIENPDNKNL